MKHWFHNAVVAISTRLNNSKTWKEFHSGGGALTSDVSITGEQTTRIPNQTGSSMSTYTGPIGNIVTYTLYDAEPGTSGTTEKGSVESTFGNSNHPKGQGILSLKITRPNGKTISLEATDANQAYIQGVFDRLQTGLRKSFDLRTAGEKIDSAATDLSGLGSAKMGIPAKAFNVSIRP